MSLVINWKPPQGVTSPEQVENFLRSKGLSINVVQSHRVPSGKLNTTFDGTDSEISNIWGFVKGLEKEELLKKFRKKSTPNRM